MMNILFLGYSKEQTKLVEFLEQRYRVYNTSDKVSEDFIKNFDWIISFGYRHILTKSQLDSINGCAINLHISYLPFNRGSHPNFWAFYDNTPIGVTIHKIDSGLDTGDILLQEKFDLNPNDYTFKESYDFLIDKIENLLMSNIDLIINEKIKPTPQIGKGTYHKSSNLPYIKDWNTNIKRYLKMINKTDKEIIDEIEKIRSRNNTNWMDAVRLAFELAPERARGIFKDIQECDSQITDLLKQLSNNEKKS